MIGRVKNFSRFGIFVTFLASELTTAGIAMPEMLKNQPILTGLLRWSDVSRSEKFHRNETLTISIKAIHDNGKIDLMLPPEDFLEKYEKTLARTSEVLQKLQIRNQEVRQL